MIRTIDVFFLCLYVKQILIKVPLFSHGFHFYGYHGKQNQSKQIKHRSYYKIKQIKMKKFENI